MENSLGSSIRIIEYLGMLQLSLKQLVSVYSIENNSHFVLNSQQRKATHLSQFGLKIGVSFLSRDVFLKFPPLKVQLLLQSNIFQSHNTDIPCINKNNSSYHSLLNKMNQKKMKALHTKKAFEDYNSISKVVTSHYKKLVCVFIILKYN